jgi:hypothetical protein
MPIIIPIKKGKKLRFRKLKSFAQGHMDNEWQGWDANLLESDSTVSCRPIP